MPLRPRCDETVARLRAVAAALGRDPKAVAIALLRAPELQAAWRRLVTELKVLRECLWPGVDPDA